MQPFEPFTGVLVLPDRAVFGSVSPVLLGRLAFELQSPALSIVQAVGLAQCMRAAVEAQRSSAASS